MWNLCFTQTSKCGVLSLLNDRRLHLTEFYLKQSTFYVLSILIFLLILNIFLKIFIDFNKNFNWLLIQFQIITFCQSVIKIYELIPHQKYCGRIFLIIIIFWIYEYIWIYILSSHLSSIASADLSKVTFCKTRVTIG